VAQMKFLRSLAGYRSNKYELIANNRVGLNVYQLGNKIKS